MYSLESTTALTALADAIRSKTSTTANLTVSEMATAVDGISTTGTMGVEITGDCSYMFQKASHNQLLPYISTTAITNATAMFSNNTAVEAIPFTLHLASSTTQLNSLFYNCDNLKQVSSLDWGTTAALNFVAISSLFSACHNLREIPDDFFNRQSITSESCSTVFNNCYSLREIPTSFSKVKIKVGTQAPYFYTYFNAGFNNCYSLNKIENLNFYISDAGLNGGDLYNNDFVNNCHRLSKLTFGATTSGYCKVYNQTLNLSGQYIGYASTASHILDYNSGITADKKVSDSASYAALKNDPDWWTDDIAYSRYNHNSAVETINSLPTGYQWLGIGANPSTTNPSVIMFDSNSGANTTGGAISTLTAAEIAVATDKGWTVALS